jgi:predicted membrane protein
MPQRNRIELIANIIIWVIAGSVVLFSTILGIIGIVAIPSAGSIILCCVFVFGSSFIAFTFITLCKVVPYIYFHSSLFKDYKRRKKRGELGMEHYISKWEE